MNTKIFNYHFQEDICLNTKAECIPALSPEALIMFGPKVKNSYYAKNNDSYEIIKFINKFARIVNTQSDTKLFDTDFTNTLINVFIDNSESLISQCINFSLVGKEKQVKNYLNLASLFLDIAVELNNRLKNESNKTLLFIVSRMCLSALAAVIDKYSTVKFLENFIVEKNRINEELLRKFFYLKEKAKSVLKQEESTTMELEMLFLAFHYPIFDLESFSSYDDQQYGNLFLDFKNELNIQLLNEINNFLPLPFSTNPMHQKSGLYKEYLKANQYFQEIWDKLKGKDNYLETLKLAYKNVLNNWYYKKYGLSSDALRSLLRSQYQETKELAQTIIEKEIVYFEGGTIEASLHLLTLAEKYLAKSNNVKGYKEFINATNRNKGNTFLLKRNLGILEAAIYYVEIKHEDIDLYKKFKDEKSDIFIDFNENREWSNFFPSDENKDKIIECFAFTAQEVIDCPVYVQHFKEKIEYIASKKDNRIAAIEIYYVNDLPSDIKRNLEKDLQGKFVKSYGNFRKYQIFQ